MLKLRKVGWSDYGRKGVREGGGNCLKYLKRGWNKKEQRGNKYFQKGGKLGQGVGALKGGGLEPPYELWSLHIPIMEYTEAELSLSTGLEMKMI